MNGIIGEGREYGVYEYTHGPFRPIRMYVVVERDRWLLPITTKVNLFSEVDLARADIVRQVNVKKREKKKRKRAKKQKSKKGDQLDDLPRGGRGGRCGENVRIICVLDSLLLSFAIDLSLSHMALLIPSVSI